MQGHPVPPSTVSPSPRRRRCVLALLAIALVTILGFFGWRWFTTPEVPVFDLTGVDPRVVKAIEEARQELIRAPRSGAAWGRLGMVLLANKLDRQALPCFIQAERFDPNNPRWPYIQGLQLAVMPAAEVLAPLRRAVELCEQFDPDNCNPHLILSEFFLEKEDLAEAEVLLRRVLQRQPDNPRAQLGLGVLYGLQNDLQTSLAHLHRAAESPYTRGQACRHLIQVYHRLGNEAGAAQYSQKAQSLPPDLAWKDPYVEEVNQHLQGQARWRKEAEILEENGKFQGKIGLLHDMLRDYPEGTAQEMLGVTLAKQGDVAGAEQALVAALEIRPGLLSTLYNLVLVRMRLADQLRSQGKEAEARGMYQKTAEAARRGLAVQPNHAALHLFLGLSLKHLDCKEEALDAMKKAVQCRPEDFKLHFFLGQTLLEMGRREEALAALRQAAELAPPNDDRPRRALEEAARKGG